jgi:hypothetical protein
MGNVILKKKAVLSYFIFDAIKEGTMKGAHGKPEEEKKYKQTFNG